MLLTGVILLKSTVSREEILFLALFCAAAFLVLWDKAARKTKGSGLPLPLQSYQDTSLPLVAGKTAGLTARTAGNGGKEKRDVF